MIPKNPSPMPQTYHQEHLHHAEKEIPVGVKIISVLYYIGAVVIGLLGILFLVASGFVGSIAEQIPFLAVFGSGIFIIGGIVFLGFGVLDFFIGRGLWKGRNWARIVAIIFACIGILVSVISMIGGEILGNILNFAMSLAIGGYLLFSQKVKEAFA